MSLEVELWKILNEGLVDHGKEELERAGLFDKDSDYDGMLGEAVLELLQTFSKQGHSGFSAQLTMELFNKLVKYETLTEITDDPEEWMAVSEDMALGEGVWQSRRNPALFSNDGGKNYYSIDDDKRELKKAKHYE